MYECCNSVHQNLEWEQGGMEVCGYGIMTDLEWNGLGIEIAILTGFFSCFFNYLKILRGRVGEGLSYMLYIQLLYMHLPFFHLRKVP